MVSINGFKLTTNDEAAQSSIWGRKYALISQKNALLKKNIPSEAGNFGLMPKDVSVDSPVSGVAKTARLALF